MTPIFTRRALSGAAAFLAVLAGVSIGTGATAANAASKDVFSVETGFSRTVPLRTGGHGDAYRPLSLTFRSWIANGDLLRGVKVAVDGSALRGFGELALPAGCSYTTDHLHERCVLSDAQSRGGFSVGVRAAAGAKGGESGDVIFKVTAKNATESHDPHVPQDTVNVTAGDGPDLALNDLGRSIKAAPGAHTALPLRVTNLGSQDGKGVVLFVHDQYEVATVLGNHSNCVYEHSDRGQSGAYCTFKDTVIKPGQTMELKDPLTLAIPAGGHGDQIQYGAGLVGDDWIGQPEGKRGTGDELSLVPVTASRARALDATHDIDSYNNLYYTDLVTGNVTDISAEGGTLSSVIGKDTVATFVARNTGTSTFSTVDDDFHGTVWISVLFPSTVRVTATPKGCTSNQGGPEGLSAYPLPQNVMIYHCFSRVPLKPGQRAEFAFHITPLQPVSGQYAGMVALTREDPTADYENNIARLYIKAGKAGEQTPASSSGPSADGSHSGDSLAESGGGNGMTWTAAGGATVLALGVGAVIITRRRKTSSA